MTAKEFLMQGILLDRQIDAKFEQIQQWRALAEKRTANYTPSPGGGSPTPDRRMDIVAKIVDAERELDAEIDRLIDLKKDISEVIARISHDRMRLLLELRYVNGHKWGEIARMMHYSESNAKNLHSAALKKVSTLLDHEM